MILPTLLVLVPTLIGPADLATRGKECRIKPDVSPKIAKSVAARVDNYCENFARFYEERDVSRRSLRLGMFACTTVMCLLVVVFGLSSE